MFNDEGSSCTFVGALQKLASAATSKLNEVEHWTTQCTRGTRMLTNTSSTFYWGDSRGK